MSDNMRIYNAVREVPKEARKPITAGRLKGMTDINPMWRIKKLTELFGPMVDVLKREMKRGSSEPIEGQMRLFGAKMDEVDGYE